VGVEMATHVRAEVEMHLFLPSKHLKIETFTPDSVVPVPKPGVKGVRNRD
jgi:hypothetical protein